MLIPVYEDEEDKTSSPFSLPNVEPFTWQWLSTVNRVNSQVQKVRVLLSFVVAEPMKLNLGLFGDG